MGVQGRKGWESSLSNVSATEIFELTAAAFGISFEQLAERKQGKHGKLPLPAQARGTAVMLAHRHTTATFKGMGEIIGWTGNACGVRLRQLADRIPDLVAADVILRARIEAIESAIDELHEKRLEAMERASANGFAGLAWIATRSLRRPRPTAGMI